MMFYEDRLTTFEHWSKQIQPDKYRLAKAGFYYTGEIDKVICFACGATLREWERTDDPWTEHYKWSKTCVFLKMTGYEGNLNVIDKGTGGFQFQTTAATTEPHLPVYNNNQGTQKGGFHFPTKPTTFGSVQTSRSRPLDSNLFVKRF